MNPNFKMNPHQKDALKQLKSSIECYVEAKVNEHVASRKKHAGPYHIKAIEQRINVQDKVDECLKELVYHCLTMPNSI